MGLPYKSSFSVRNLSFRKTSYTTFCKKLKSFCKIYLTKSKTCDIIVTTGGDKVAKNLKLKSARAAMDMSQQALAEKVGVSRQTITAIEKGDY
ncbi:MAG: helix-turn-helix domain-containing protein, partial [Oscillospiraceae bacterium]|nr:helix-turn-helix domain-containing protein [Oscillospiraceae bacterium]